MSFWFSLVTLARERFDPGGTTLWMVATSCA